MKIKLSKIIITMIITGMIMISFDSCKKEGGDDNNIVKDIDGNIYHTVTIGTQVWLVENLRTTHYQNGDAIPNISDQVQWSKFTTGAYCNYANNVDNGPIYGHLYNYYSITDLRKIAPKGYHISTLEDWTNLLDFAGGSYVAGKLKESGTLHWAYPNIGATNEYGFTALGGGARLVVGTFVENKIRAQFWFASAVSPGFAIFDVDKEETILSANIRAVEGKSIRCLKD